MESATRNYKRRKLCLEARETAEFRGHDLRKFINLDTNIWESCCFNCNMSVIVDIDPPANGIDISGPAVALNCESL